MMKKFDYKEKRLELIREMTPLRKFYKTEGHVWHDGKVMWHNEDGTIVPIINLKLKSVRVKSKVKKWSVERIDPTVYWSPNGEEYIIRELSKYIGQEIDRAIALDKQKGLGS